MTATSPVSVRSWRVSVFALFATNGIAAATWASRAPAIADGLHVGIGQMGALITGLPIGSIVAILLSSHVIHLLGARTAARIAVVLQSASLAVIALGAGVLGLYGLAFLGFVIFGLANSFLGIIINVAAAEIDRRSSRTLMPVFHATFSFGTFAGAGIGAIATFTGVPIIAHLGILATALVVGASVASAKLPAVQVPEGAEPVSTFRDRMSVWLEPRTLLIGVVILGAAFTEGTANNWIAITMVEERGLTEASGAAYLTLFTAAMLVGRLGGGFLVDRVGRTAALRGALLLAVAGILVVVFVASPVGTAIGIAAWGIGASLGYPLSISAAADDPRNAVARVSAVAAVGAVAFLVGPSIVGIIGEHSNLLVAFVVVAALIAVSLTASGATKPLTVRAEHDELASGSGTETL